MSGGVLFFLIPIRFSRPSFIIYLIDSYELSYSYVFIPPDSFSPVLPPSSEVSLGVDVMFMISNSQQILQFDFFRTVSHLC